MQWLFFLWRCIHLCHRSRWHRGRYEWNGWTRKGYYRIFKYFWWKNFTICFTQWSAASPLVYNHREMSFGRFFLYPFRKLYRIFSKWMCSIPYRLHWLCLCWCLYHSVRMSVPRHNTQLMIIAVQNMRDIASFTMLRAQHKYIYNVHCNLGHELSFQIEFVFVFFFFRFFLSKPFEIACCAVVLITNSGSTASR